MADEILYGCVYCEQWKPESEYEILEGMVDLACKKCRDINEKEKNHE